MRTSRCTIRRLMFLVAVSAVLMSPFSLYGRSVRFREIALASQQEYINGPLTDLEIYLWAAPAQGESLAQLEARRAKFEPVDRLVRFLVYHQTMSAKYEDAAAQPWRLVDWDPPAPPKPMKGDAEACRAWIEAGCPESVNSP